MRVTLLEAGARNSRKDKGAIVTAIDALFTTLNQSDRDAVHQSIMKRVRGKRVRTKARGK